MEYFQHTCTVQAECILLYYILCYEIEMDIKSSTTFGLYKSAYLLLLTTSNIASPVIKELGTLLIGGLAYCE